ncbi:sensor histidine kinase [Oceanobacillus picturae]|uniref:sensor histidine kinase n=1 Tax=Oceanobacillus picturae TaxID=171693 RepID=UPI0036384FAB
MKTIRGKLLIYFFVFVLLFQITAISIFVSSNQLTTIYHDSFERFLLLNSISHQSEVLYTETKALVSGTKSKDGMAYYVAKQKLEDEKERLSHKFENPDEIEMKNYLNLIDTFIYESELTAGFVIKDDIEQYTLHLEEARVASEYIQAAALEILDVELTDYQSFYTDMQQRNEDFFLFILLLFSTTILLAIFFALWFSKGITRPIAHLSHAARDVAKGKLTGEPVHVESNDELKVLGDAFNNMRSNIHGLVEEIKDQSELDRLVKDMELKHLQSQINPHFLFNTLNTVSKLAYLEDAKSTSKLIDSIATLLRHSLGQLDKQVALQDEVAVVRDYFHIQKVRFSERIAFKTAIDESCLDIRIPSLTLQPLVENAFIHGIETMEEGGTISLSVYQAGPEVIVEVTDDGVGMSQEQIRDLTEEMEAEKEHVGHSTGIGLTNVIRRLQLYYQKKDVVEILSNPGEGTTIRLTLPKKEGEANAHPLS